MKVLTLRRWAELEAGERNRILERATSQILDPKLLESIGRIYADVAARGDAAVADATERFDGVRVDPNALLVDEAALDKAHASLPPALLDAIRFAIASVRAFNEAQRAASPDWRREIRPGVEVGERMRPIPSAGLFVPCGKGSYPSVLVMIGTPAVVAGVPEITVVVPPMPGTDRVDPGVLATAKELGIRRVLRANGPAGVAAVALGTATIPRVAKIVGPGSPAVTAAQVLAQIHGVATNMLCGPSESLIIADDSIDPVRLIGRLGDRPVLLIQGTADQVDPPAEASDRNFQVALAAGVPVELAYCPGARHGLTVKTCPTQWGSWATSFLERARKH